MINFKFLLGLYPKTASIEAKEAALISEFNELDSYKDSDELKRFFELKSFVESAEFKSKEQEIKEINYKTSDAFKKETTFIALKKSPRIVNYYKVKDSADYKNYTEVAASSDLKEYLKLKETVENADFKKNESEIKSLKYKESQEFKDEQEFLALQKSKEIKNHFKTITTEGFKLYQLLHDSDDLKHYKALQQYAESEQGKEIYKTLKTSKDASGLEVDKIKEYETLKKDSRYTLLQKYENSPEFKLYNETIKSGKVERFETLKEKINTEEFKRKKEYLLLAPAKRWEQTEESKLATTYKKLAAEAKIKSYLKFSISKELALFNEVEKAGEIPQYEDLKQHVESEQFATEKKYMLLPAKTKWEQTEEFAKHKEFLSLQASEKVKWYFKVYESKKFDELKGWKLTFSDDFEGDKLDSEKWLTRFFWGDTMLHESFSLSEDLHYNTDGKNLKLDSSILKIETRQEKVTGKAWNPLFGFIPKEFEYTSGLINTGKSFRQQYGRFRAKIRMSQNTSVTNAFWMVGNQVMPHIDVAKFVGNNVNFNFFWGNIAEKDGIKHSADKLGAGKLKNDFFIYELEWTPNELIWRINGLELKRISGNLPQEPMYLQFSSGIYSNGNNSLPDSMEIDWVKCYSASK